MANTLVAPFDLTPFPGSPFSAELVDIAAAAVRAEAGWHIAPVETQTIILDYYGGQELRLPTRRVVSVTVTSTAGPVGDWTRYGSTLVRLRGWPVGPLTLTLQHGYATTPLDLLPVIADRTRTATNPRDPSVASVSVGQVSETYRTGGSVMQVVDPVVARYALLAGIA